MPDDETTVPPEVKALCDRVDSAGLQQLTLLESAVHAVRLRLNDESLTVADVVALADRMGALSHLMYQWARMLIGQPLDGESCTTCEHEED